MSNNIGWGQGAFNNNIGWGQGSDVYTTEVVEISSAQILAIASTPIELLPAAGEGKYYDVEKVILEFTEGASAYTGDAIIGVGSPLMFYLEAGSFNGASFISIMTPTTSALDEVNGVTFAYTTGLNQPVNLERWSGAIADGNGTLRVTINYRLVTFGV